MKKVETPFLDVEQAAQFLRIKPSTVYNWVHRKKQTKIPVRYHGRKLVFLAEELIEYSNSLNKAG